MNTCRQCGEFIYASFKHKCHPKFDVSVYDDEFGNTSHGIDARDAAEEYVRRNFSGLDYPSEIEIFVRPHGSMEAPKRFCVTVETVPSFTAREIKNAPV